MSSANKNIELEAQKVIRFDLKQRVAGGYKLTHKPSSYGMVIKWLVYIRGMTYAQFAQRYNGTTAQNMNHLINRTTRERFFEENVERMCEILNISYDHFVELCEKVEEHMEK